MVLDEYKRLERIRAIYTQITPSLVIMAISVYTLSFIALWPVYDKPILMVWFISGLIITFLRKRSAMIFAKQELTTENCDDWARRAIVWAFLSGVSWGFICLFCFCATRHTHVYEQAYLYRRRHLLHCRRLNCGLLY